VTAVDTATSVNVTVTLSAASDQEVTVDYATADGSATSAADYDTTSGTLTFAAGDTSETINIALKDGRDTNTTKSFVVNLSSPVNATIADAQADITLLDTQHSTFFNNPTLSSTWGDIGVFSNASSCATCHTGNSTVMNFEGIDISPATQQKHSIMAHALNDPFFTAMVEEETHVFPHAKVFIEDTCLRCHAPMAYTHAHQNPELLVDEPLGLLEDGGYAFDTAMNDPHAREGISCTACHQIQNPMVDPETKELLTEMPTANMSGHYKINSPEENPVTGPYIFGPIASPSGNAMQNQTQYTPEYAAHISESAMCATCHNLYTPTLNLEGQLHTIDPATGDYDPNGEIAQFPEQTPYWDWLNSKYSDPTTGKTCQACHMAEPDPTYTTPVAVMPNGNISPSRSNFSVHELVGGNSYLLGLLSKYMTELGIADKTTEAGFNEKIAQTQSLLKTAADLTIGAQSVVNSTLSIPVTITNLTGHKLPASFPSRRMWVHLKITDNNGSVLLESGRHENGRIVGKDDLFTASQCLTANKADGCYEAHRDTISSSDQVAIYESVLGDVNQDITHVLLHARQYIKDNRMPPQGWTLANRHQNPVDQTLYDDNIIGAAFDDANFAAGKDGAGSDGKDTITYAVDISGFSAPFNVQAELLYQPIRPSFVAAMHADDEIEGESHVRRFKAMYEDTPPVPETIAIQQTTIALD
jgi:hypothetical protein